MTTLFLVGDVMTGHGVDQILAYPGKANKQLVNIDVRFSGAMK